ncbi:MAG: hypothetical protein KKB50_00450 [Planctomycetes bacterium]|nr:hypothetical protein [Planctomycetota bacterium]
MPKRGPNRRKRVPKLSFMETQGIGWHVSYRDPVSGSPRRHRFGIAERTGEDRARALYHAWVAKYLGIETELPTKNQRTRPPKLAGPKPLSGSLIEVASSLIEAERGRIRREGEPRRRGTIDPRVFSDRRKQIRDFLAFLNSRHGDGAVATLRLADLTMDDVEAYNRHVAAAGYSASQVAKRMQIVRAIIDRAGRPEHGLQLLTWNWNSRDTAHGKPSTERILPTKAQLLKLLQATDLRGRTMIWLGIGLGFGARDLAALRVGQISNEAYDLRRGKTGVRRPVMKGPTMGLPTTARFKTAITERRAVTLAASMRESTTGARTRTTKRRAPTSAKATSRSTSTDQCRSAIPARPESSSPI